MLGGVQRALLARSRGGVMNTTQRRLDGPSAQTIATGARERRWPAHWAMGVLAITVLATVLPARISYSADGDAVDPMNEVTWFHTSPNDVRSFVLFVSPVSGSMAEARQIDVGKPGGSDSGSAKFFSALVPIAIGDFVAVAAIGQNGLLSDVSDWSTPQPSQPGQPLVVQP
jgi:hypothetical protein